MLCVAVCVRVCVSYVFSDVVLIKHDTVVAIDYIVHGRTLSLLGLGEILLKIGVKWYSVRSFATARLSRCLRTVILFSRSSQLTRTREADAT